MRLDVFHHIVDNEQVDYNDEFTDDMLENIDNEPTDSEASISFSIKKDGNIGINFEFGETPEIAELMGSLLFDISKGNLTDSITEIMLAQRERNPRNAEFIETIIYKWQDMIKQNDEVLATPVVPATKTFAVSRTQ